MRSEVVWPAVISSDKKLGLAGQTRSGVGLGLLLSKHIAEEHS